jgi:ABC-type multidrug transport system ATPase subunit
MVKERLTDVLLYDVANKKAGEFSGGMKRRLSMAISAVGDPKVIYLDEPTTGLDPMSRREIWGAIQRLKKGRVIILTSHSMEEADLLGDRIGVMADGHLRCIGTSLHLKNKFGLGYRLNLNCKDNQQHALREMVNAMLPGSELIAESGTSFVFGIKTENMEKVIPFFKHIEENMDNPQFLVKDWGISQTTLEEVFLKVTKHGDDGVVMELPA